MVSIRELAACVFTIPASVPDGFKWPGDISVLQDLFGYLKAPQTLSLLQLTGLLTRKHIHLNLIRVGCELFTDDDEAEIDFAVHVLRLIYASVDLSIGRVKHYYIPLALANGREIIENDDETEALTNEWTFPNDAIDVFLVRAYAGATIGRSAVQGPCNKDVKDRMTGSVVAMEGFPWITGLVLAHEIGHYLGLSAFHSDDPNNLMFPTVPNGAQLTAAQGETMKQHCFIRSNCRGG